ncbi:phosphatase PAP2 family protein [Lactobacillus helveticus]|uniref:Phosphatidylglycerophosphatase B n=1 Tax=Lactobacillus helveticus TaxID=1587 RepID=A0A3Q8SPE9_LACHE|nr:phosphatase PAP2 family protein [Lactobacillus helveticus]AFR22235.1 membrane-associated phospholipid phosphatase [Lactobacillus helveticus R0052]AZK90886.1 phosphatidylglycerophosphatase B [Lactobacillus helveticus]MBW8061213.1 phosphatase PAP2 family protein [Lactobacillus helveticus]MCJ2190390.1 phosphatase PAP2 family protein [Lactobacillus helveticus]MED7628423.1 PAP2 family protein [Lactobacillus helveticus]
MNSYIVLLLAVSILLLLIFNIKTSRRFNLFDHWLHQQLVKKHDGYKWQVIAFINDPKLMVVWDVLLAGLLLNEERNLTAIWVLGTLGFADASGIVMKKLIRRRRPIMHSDMENGYSFPSGHVLGATTMGLILLQLFAKEFGLIFIIGIVALWVMVIISRLSLKAHYPSDIVGATSLAIVCFSISQQLFLAF